MRKLLAVMLMWLLLVGSALAHGGDIRQRDYPHQIGGEHIAVYYQTKGPDAVSQAYAQEVFDLAETSYKKLVTEGGLRPPRVGPVPIYLTDTGGGVVGTASSEGLGFDAFVTISSRVTDKGRLADVVAHELFHVLQTAYQKGGATPGWGIEGTASVAPVYVFGPGQAGHRSAMTSHLSMYWVTHRTTLFDRPYDASLFWYLTAERYGGLTYIDRLLTWSEDVEWTRAAQLAAMELGAPPDTTFDTLYRSFVFDLLRGQVPKGYETNKWLQPIRMRWTGQSASLTRAELTAGMTKSGQGYAYYQPLIVQPYSFHVIEISHQSGSPAELSIGGDPALEAYVLRPGADYVEALREPSQRPNMNTVMAPPAEPNLQAVRLPMGESVRLDGPVDGRTLVAVLRTGHWGPGTYRLDLKPVGSGVAAPQWQRLVDIPHAAHSPGAPPPLSEAERRALAAGTWLTGSLPLAIDDSLAGQSFARLELTVGSKTAWLGDQEVTLPFPVQRSGGDMLFPARAVARLLGFTVEGNRFTWGDGWLEVTPGSTRAQIPQGTLMLRTAPLERDGDLLMDSSFLFFTSVSCERSTRADTMTIICPGPADLVRRAAENGH